MATVNKENDDPASDGHLSSLFREGQSGIEAKRCARAARPRRASLKLKPCPILQSETHTQRSRCRCRCDNLFQQLETRSLTDEEEKIIAQRVRVGVVGEQVGVTAGWAMPGARRLSLTPACLATRCKPP